MRLRPDARSHGNFLHRIFERALNIRRDESFDRRLEQAISETSQEREFQAIYQESLEAQFTKEVLLDVARATGHILRHNSEMKQFRKKLSLVARNKLLYS